MSLNFNEMPTGGSKKSYPKIGKCTTLGRIVSIIDVGTQPQTDWQTKQPTDPKHIIMITFELPNKKITIKDNDGNEIEKPRWITKDYLMSNSEMSSLYKLKKELVPDAESAIELLNAPCMVGIGVTTGGNDKIVTVSQPVEGVEVPELSIDAFYFDFDHPDIELFNGLLKWQQEKVKSALDYNGFADNEVSAATGTHDDIPF